MKQKYKELCVLLAVSVSILTALGAGPLAWRSTPNPVKFFDPSSSLITDFEYGELNKLSIRALESDVSFVMHYAPWDADCIRFKNEYETVAKHYNHQIFFAAINCWWPDGDCGRAIKLKRFPLFLAHVRNGGEVEYRGPLVAYYIIAFLDNLLDPVIPLQGDGDLLELRSKHDAVLVGYYDFNDSPSPIGYKSYMNSAIRSLALDPWRRVQFAVVTARRVANKLNIKKPSSLTLYQWNSTLIYELVSSATGKAPKSDAIVRWLFDTMDHSGSLVEWITPSGVKSNAMNLGVRRTPSTFILFTPRSLILGISPYFDVLREVAMDYYNCDKSPVVRALVHRSILRRHLMEERLMELEEKCNEMNNKDQLSETTTKSSDGDTCCQSQPVKWRLTGRVVDKKCFCTACVQVSIAKCPGGCKRFNCLATASRYLASFEPNLFVNTTATFCNQVKAVYQPKHTPYFKISVTCSGVSPQGLDDDQQNMKLSGVGLNDDNEQIGTFGKSKLGQNDPSLNQRDEKIERMVASFETQYCSRLNLGLNNSDLNFPDSGEGTSSSQSWRSDFTGLRCTTNKSLSFIAMDSILFPSFAESFGIDVFNETHATVAVIFEEANENLYLLNHELSARALNLDSSASVTINKRSIYEFIKNYTTGDLPRYLRSSAVTSSSENCLKEADGSNIVCVPEVTSDSFKTIVLDSKKDVLMFYYTPWCGFCSSVAHVYLSVARFFLGVEGIVFARINPDKNDLPFEYTVDRYPTILLFPANRKADSQLYPHNMPITVTSLVQFVLANSQPSVRFQASFQLCDRTCLARNMVSYSSQSREILRRIKVQRNAIFELNSKFIWPQTFSNKQRRLQVESFVKHLKTALVANKAKARSMNDLLALLKIRIMRFDGGRPNELSEDLLHDMLRLIQQPTQPRSSKPKETIPTALPLPVPKVAPKVAKSAPVSAVKKSVTPTAKPSVEVKKVTADAVVTKDVVKKAPVLLVKKKMALERFV